MDGADAVATIYLVRHGQASFGTDDYDILSPLGHRQSEVVGTALKARGVRIDVAVSGSLRRQRETADDCLPAAGASVPLRIDLRWNEYSFDDLLAHHPAPPESGPGPEAGAGPESAAGSEAGSDRAAFQRSLDGALVRWMAAGEASGAAPSWPAFRGGVSAALEEVAVETGRGRTAVVFTSGGAIAAVCAGLLELDSAGYVAMNRVVVNGSLTKIAYGRSGLSLVTFNEHAHFEGEGRALRTNR